MFAKIKQRIKRIMNGEKFYLPIPQQKLKAFQSNILHIQ